MADPLIRETTATAPASAGVARQVQPQAGGFNLAAPSPAVPQAPAPAAPAAPAAAPQAPARRPSAVPRFDTNPVGAIGAVLLDLSRGLQGKPLFTDALMKQDRDAEIFAMQKVAFAMNIQKTILDMGQKVPSDRLDQVFANLKAQAEPLLGVGTLDPIIESMKLTPGEQEKILSIGGAWNSELLLACSPNAVINRATLGCMMSKAVDGKTIEDLRKSSALRLEDRVSRKAGQLVAIIDKKAEVWRQRGVIATDDRLARDTNNNVKITMQQLRQLNDIPKEKGGKFFTPKELDAFNWLAENKKGYAEQFGIASNEYLMGLKGDAVKPQKDRAKLFADLREAERRKQQLVNEGGNLTQVNRLITGINKDIAELDKEKGTEDTAQIKNLDALDEANKKLDKFTDEHGTTGLDTLRSRELRDLVNRRDSLRSKTGLEDPTDTESISSLHLQIREKEKLLADETNPTEIKRLRKEQADLLRKVAVKTLPVGTTLSEFEKLLRRGKGKTAAEEAAPLHSAFSILIGDKGLRDATIGNARKVGINVDASANDLAALQKMKSSALSMGRTIGSIRSLIGPDAAALSFTNVSLNLFNSIVEQTNAVFDVMARINNADKKLKKGDKGFIENTASRTLDAAKASRTGKVSGEAWFDDIVKKYAITGRELQQRFYRLAYSAASALAAQEGRGLSDRDVEIFMEIIGKGQADPAVAQRLLSNLMGDVETTNRDKIRTVLGRSPLRSIQQEIDDDILSKPLDQISNTEIEQLSHRGKIALQRRLQREQQ